MKKIENDSIILEIALLYDELPELKHYKYGFYPHIPIGGGNSYYQCKFCNTPDPAINLQNSKHDKKCKWVQAQERIKFCIELLNDYEKENISYLIEDLND